MIAVSLAVENGEPLGKEKIIAVEDLSTAEQFGRPFPPPRPFRRPPPLLRPIVPLRRPIVNINVG